MSNDLEDTVHRLETRVRELEDERAILDTLYAYAHSLDYGDRDEWIGVWTEDAELTWPFTTFHGRVEITKAYDDHSHAPQAFHKHVLVEPRVTIDGDRATVSSYFARVNNSASGPVTRSFGRYLDVLVRESDGKWRIRQRVAERESIIPDAPNT